MTSTETPSGLKIGPARPSTAQFSDAGVPQDAPPLPFGPDFTQTPEKDPPKINQKNPPRAASDTKRGGKSDSGKGRVPFGLNKKVRSPVRKLTREAPNGETKSDFERLVAWYQRIGKMAAPFHPKFANAMWDQAEDCADSWFDLAETNDTVRRYVLAMIEGGAWGKVIAAHTPIFLAVIPEETLNRFFLRGMGLFAANLNVEQDTGEE